MTENKEEKLKRMTGKEFYDTFTKKVLKKEITVQQYNYLQKLWTELHNKVEQLPSTGNPEVDKLIYEMGGKITNEIIE